VRALGADFGERVSEYRECCAAGECCCRSQDSVEFGVSGGGGDGSGDRAVVGGEVIGVDAEMCSRGGVGEVEDVQADRYPAHTAAHFERVDTVVEEVAKKLCPGALLAVGSVPDARFASSVIATGAASGISARRQWVAGRALMPVAAGQLASRCGGDRVSGAQT